MTAGRARVAQLLRLAGLGRPFHFPLVLDHGLFNFLALDWQGRRVGCDHLRRRYREFGLFDRLWRDILRLRDLLLLDIIAFRNELHVDRLKRGNRRHAREAKKGRDADMRQKHR